MLLVCFEFGRCQHRTLLRNQRLETKFRRFTFRKNIKFLSSFNFLSSLINCKTQKLAANLKQQFILNCHYEMKYLIITIIIVLRLL
jgi:hypothetical protein